MAQELVHTLGHLRGGLVGERDREDLVGANAALFNEIGDAVGDDAGLSRARAGQQQNGAIDGLDAFALLRVHVVEKAGHGGHSTLYVNRLRGG